MDEQPMGSVTVREHLTDIIVQKCKYLESRIDGVEKATELARKELERRLEGMNEFRAQLTDQTRTFVSKDYYDRMHEVLCGRVNELEKYQHRMEGKADQKSVNNALMIAAAGIIISLLSLLLTIIG